MCGIHTALSRLIDDFIKIEMSFYQPRGNQHTCKDKPQAIIFDSVTQPYKTIRLTAVNTEILATNIHTHKRTLMNACTQTHTHTHIHTHAHASTYTHIHTYTNTHTQFL